jgi:ElaB/YqjD/DUF883 family membrane-anchored ribosome-binding protein
MMQKENQPMTVSASTESSEVSQQMLHQVADMASALAQQRTHLHTSQTRLIEHTQQAITAMESHLMSHMTEVEQNVSTQLMQGAQWIQTAKSEFKELSSSHSTALSALNSRVNDLQTQFSEQQQKQQKRVQPPTPQPSQAVSHAEAPQTTTIDTESIVSTIEQSVIARLDQVDAQLESHLDAIEANAHAAIREAAQHQVRAVVWPAVQTTIEEMWTQHRYISNTVCNFSSTSLHLSCFFFMQRRVCRIHDGACATNGGPRSASASSADGVAPAVDCVRHRAKGDAVCAELDSGSLRRSCRQVDRRVAIRL